ncbi:PAS domain-containing protein [Hwanghaeella grinnelliae]|uniref:PAS domain-containing protein n=1 Tax=Hwanghaeella grinnelliae TaxID=2500179 RepID=A0A437QV40_9PROT|nr:PAS domain-containing protein [Hwanghaeella grinnelliae]RVU38377.1 PAS domain-containing protein [Hwanghaeella grinnelliae]
MTVWRRHQGWTYKYFEPDVDPAEIPTFSDLVALWQSKRQGRHVPTRADFNFYDFKGWHGWVCIHEVRYDPFDYTVRLSGSSIDSLYGLTTQGFGREEMNEVYSEQVVRDEFDEFACRNLFISYIEGPLNIKDRTFTNVKYLELPLSEDGEMADHTIEILYPYKR